MREQKAQLLDWLNNQLQARGGGLSNQLQARGGGPDDLTLESHESDAVRVNAELQEVGI